MKWPRKAPTSSRNVSASSTTELGTTETELAEFKQRAGLTDISSDAQLALQESSKYEQQYAENATQINLVNYLRDYINNPANNDEIIPANVGLSDMNLTSAIDKYNNLIVERKRCYVPPPKAIPPSSI
mgnify:CR=1 FL=1